MNARHFWFVALAISFPCGCGRQSTAPSAPSAQTDSGQPTNDRREQAVPLSHAADEPQSPREGVAAPARALTELRAALDRAFERLRKQGIVAEPNFEFSVRDAVVGISQLIEERGAVGGVYWHEQDDENLERGEDLNIGFVGKEDQSAVDIAQKLVAALKAEGLTVEWDGSADNRVTVKVAFNSVKTSERPRVPLERVGQIAGSERGLQGDLALQGKYVYWVLAGKLRVMDVSEATRPLEVGSLEIAGMAERISVSGTIACVFQEQRLVIVDVSDARAPRVAGSCDLGVDVWGPTIQDRQVCVTCAGSVRVIDISDPTAPHELGRGAVECGEAITVSGKYAYLACTEHGMHVVDISDPRNPKQVGTFRTTDGAMDVTVAQKLAYLTSMENDVFGLYVVDVSAPESPKQVAHYGNWMTGGVALQGHYAYLASGNLSVLDVADPSAPQEVGSFDVAKEPATVAWRVAVAGDYAYVLGDGKQGFSVLQMVWEASPE